MSAGDFAIGVDVGGTNMRAARISPSGEILKKRSIAGSRDPAIAVDLIKDLVREMDGGGAHAIGIGVPGRVDGRTGEVLSGGFLDLAGIDLRLEMEKAFGRPASPMRAMLQSFAL
jgi:glucokinase